MFTRLMVIIFPIIGMAGDSGDLEGGVGRMGTWLGMVRGGGTGGRLAGGRLWILLNAELKEKFYQFVWDICASILSYLEALS